MHTHAVVHAGALYFFVNLRKTAGVELRLYRAASPDAEWVPWIHAVPERPPHPVPSAH